MIKSGTIRIYRKTQENIETELAVLGPGDSFGEMALLTGAPRAANVLVVEDAELTSLSKDQFGRILKNYPVVASRPQATTRARPAPLTNCAKTSNSPCP